MKNIIVIGAGFGGMSAAAYLAKQGNKVTVIEKNERVGGRAQVLRTKGFTFDLGPSWYMMPDVFDDFFTDLGLVQKDFYKLKKLKPHYRVIGPNRVLDVDKYLKTRNDLDTDSKNLNKLDEFMKRTADDYKAVRSGLLTKPMISFREIFDRQVLKFILSKNMYRSYHHRVSKITKDEDLRRTLEFMSVFMGGSPKNIPGIYALLSHVDMGLGVYYPIGGFGEMADAFRLVCEQLGVTFVCNKSVQEIQTSGGEVTGVKLESGEFYEAEIIVSNADYHYTENVMLKASDRSYSSLKWDNMQLSPSALLIVIGVGKRVPNLQHHTLFLESDWDAHFAAIESKSRLDNPLFYVSAPSKTDSSVAPSGQENLFVLVPISSRTQLSSLDKQRLTQNVIKRIEEYAGESFSKDIVVQQTFDQQYFADTFNAYGGNAFGPAHTLLQTAVFRPKMKSKKVRGLYYVGQYTNPGTGVPMVILSGKAVAELVSKDVNR